MSLADHAIDLILASAGEYAPRKVDVGLAHLEGLGLFLEVREVQAMAAPSMALFISEFTLSSRERARGMTVTCVGRAGDMNAAVADAVAQWSLGVLPVVAHWRGRHACLAAPAAVETRAGAFEVPGGPTILRGLADDSPPPVDVGGLIESVVDLLRTARPAPRLHWMELFACKFNDGSVDATCRLNNHDWPTATRTLKEVATRWPPPGSPILSQRQFVLIRPQGHPAQEIVLPSLWARLTGRA